MTSEVSAHENGGASPLSPTPSPTRGEGSVASRCATSLSWRERLALAADIAALPEKIRGYGPLKRSSATTARELRTALWTRWDASRTATTPTTSSQGAPTCAASTT